jgi:hypothetical protein
MDGPKNVNKFLPNHGLVKPLTSIFTPLPKKGDIRECTNNHTITLVPHASKILLTILQKQLKPYTEPQMPMKQGGLRKGHRTRDQTDNLRWITERARKHHKCVSVFYRLHKGISECEPFKDFKQHEKYGNT